MNEYGSGNDRKQKDRRSKDYRLTHVAATGRLYESAISV